MLPHVIPSSTVCHWPLIQFTLAAYIPFLMAQFISLYLELFWVCFSYNSCDVESNTSLMFLARMSTSQSTKFSAADLPPTLALKISTWFGSCSFLKTKQTLMFEKGFILNFNLGLVKTRPWLLPMSKPRCVLVLTLMMLDLKHLVIKFKRFGYGPTYLVSTKLLSSISCGNVE